MRRWSKLFRWIGHHDLGTLLLVLLVVGSTWIFVKLADEVIEGEVHGFDRKILLSLRTPGDSNDPIGPAWLEEMCRDFTALGSVGVLAFITLSVAGYLALQGKTRSVVLILASVLGGVIVSTVLKELFARPRPDVVPHLARVLSRSFPSGHSMMSAVTYLTLGALLTRVSARLVVRSYLLLLCVILTLLVGATRVYLGVHWPTDVLAGWTAGAAWAILCWLAARALQRRGEVEPPREDRPAP